MESLRFDTHSFVKRLIGAGMPEDQAEILASERSHLVETELVTRTYLDLRLAELKSEFKADNNRIEKKLGGEIQALRTETHNIEKNLGGEIQALRTETHNIEKKLGGEIQNVEKRLGGEIHNVEKRLGGEIHNVEKRLGGEIFHLQKDMRLIKWMLALVIVANMIPFLQQLF